MACDCCGIAVHEGRCLKAVTISLIECLWSLVALFVNSTLGRYQCDAH